MYEYVATFYDAAQCQVKKLQGEYFLKGLIIIRNLIKIRESMSLIDQDALKSHYGEDIEIIEDLIEIFDSTYPESMAELEKAINASDFGNIELHAHTLKGMVANFFSSELKDKFYELEKKGKEQVSVEVNELDPIKELLPKVTEELKALG